MGPIAGIVRTRPRGPAYSESSTVPIWLTFVSSHILVDSLSPRSKLWQRGCGQTSQSTSTESTCKRRGKLQQCIYRVRRSNIPRWICQLLQASCMTASNPALHPLPDAHLEASHLPLPAGLREGSLQNRWANACTAAGTGSKNYCLAGNTWHCMVGMWRSGASSGKSLAGLLVFHRIAIDPQIRKTSKWACFSTSCSSCPTAV